MQEIFLTLIARIEHSSPAAHELRLFLEFLFICSPYVAQPFALINLVLPTSHLFDHMDHDELFDLPFQGGG